MLILADGADVADLLPTDERIRLIHLDQSMRIGAKRNFGCERAAGTVVAHWDDDDHSNPGRLTDQVTRLIETGKSVTGYHSMRFTDGELWWKYNGLSNYALGTSLCYQVDWWRRNKFVTVQVGEDTQFVTQASNAGALATVDAGDFMYATNHVGNTSPRQMGSSWTEIK